MSAVAVRGGRFLVTGGSGFIGSHVADLLLAEGASSVTVLDATIREDNLAGALSGGRLRIVGGSVVDPAAASEAASGTQGVFHMATRTMGECANDPRGCLEVNVSGTLTVLEAARAAGASKVVFSSASSVYGEGDGSFDETSPLNPTTMYGASKAAAELLLRAFCTATGMDHVTLRYMNVYGPRQHGGLVVGTLERLRSGQAPMISGDGSQEFDFVHVADVAAANLRAMGSAVSGEAFNVGSGRPSSVATVVRRLLECAGSDLEPVSAPGPGGGGRGGSSRKASDLLGWKATVDLDSGLRALVREELGR